MHHKIFAAGVAMLAFAAFTVVPSVASAAQPELVDPAGALAKVKDKVRGEAPNLLFSTGSGNLECSKNVLEGEVTANPANGNPVEGEIKTGSFTGTENPGGTACKTTIKPFGTNFTARITAENLPWCLKTASKATMTWSIAPCTAGKEIQFKAELFEGATLRLTCTFKRSSVTGTFNTPNTGAGEKFKLTIGASQTFTGSGGFGCPASGTLTGDFGLFRVSDGKETMVQ